MCGAAALVAAPFLLIVLVAAGPDAPAADGLAETPTASARRDIPPDYLRWYLAAARTCPGLSWSVLAAIGKTESDHGRSTLPGVRSGENHAGAGGPMQFLAATWNAYGVDANDDGRADRYHPADAIHGAARYLCAHRAGKGGKRLERAIWHYNHSEVYVRRVLAQAAAYAQSAASGHGVLAVKAALRWLGTPYSWGGGGTRGPSYGIAHGARIKGFDCSGLTQYAWAQAGVPIDRVAADQYDDGPHIPRHQLQPGDLLFFAHNPANPATIHHVALYLGQGRMIHAPHTGDVVRIAPFAGDPYRQRQYAGATRPASRHTTDR
ncbi:Transglycosylase SLT domain-containing protein [Thermomonospora echinospora]|uniref:Transglycosylase SLT domain-containing protein n=1 Tax=Thermomonospora echinospora TaxID=1992 RepID=A0A1H5UTV6_9ACTN|nr:Transglycosylase SLT domain-containing protein [Thermomonospora echinospora]